MVIRNVTITMTMTVVIVLIVDARQGEGEGSQNKIGQIWSQRTNTRGEGVWENP